MKLRKVTGKEKTNFWQSGYGVMAGDASMVSRVNRCSSFSSHPIQTIEATAQTGSDPHTGTYSSRNLLIHSIRVINTVNDEDIYCYIRNGATTTIWGAVVGRQHRRNNEVIFKFPIPILSIGGGQIACDDGGCVISICYTVLESSDTIPDYESIYLQAVYKSGEASVTVVSDTDCEIIGVYNHTEAVGNVANDWAELVIKNGYDSDILRSGFNENTAVGSTGHDNYEPEPTFGSDGGWWFPVPIYARKGFKVSHSGNTDDAEDNARSTVYYRKLKAFDVDHGWV